MSPVFFSWDEVFRASQLCRDRLRSLALSGSAEDKRVDTDGETDNIHSQPTYSRGLGCDLTLTLSYNRSRCIQSRHSLSVFLPRSHRLPRNGHQGNVSTELFPSAPNQRRAAFERMRWRQIIGTDTQAGVLLRRFHSSGPLREEGRGSQAARVLIQLSCPEEGED